MFGQDGWILASFFFLRAYRVWTILNVKFLLHSHLPDPVCTKDVRPPVSPDGAAQGPGGKELVVTADAVEGPGPEGLVILSFNCLVTMKKRKI